MEQEINDLKRSLLASPPELAESIADLSVLVLQASGLLIGLPVEQVDEITPMVLVSPLPRAPTAVRGTISYRGRLVPVLDLSHSLSGTPIPLFPEMFLAIVSSDDSRFALAINQVEGIRQYTPQDMASAPASSSLPGFVYGLLGSEQDSVILLDPGALLNAGELDLLHGLLSATTGPGHEEDSRR